MTEWKVGDRAVVTAGHYFRKTGPLVHVTVTNVTKTRVSIIFDIPQRSTKNNVLRSSTFLSHNSIKLSSIPSTQNAEADDDFETVSFETAPLLNVNRKLGLSLSEQTQLDNTGSLENCIELKADVKADIRRLCQKFKAMGFGSSSLQMLSFVQVGMRELEE